MTQPVTPKVRTLQIPWKVLVVRADPNFEATKRRDPFYQFANGREFTGDTTRSGAYSSAPHDNPPMV